MGCRSDYLEPTAYEIEVRKTAELLLWFTKKAGITYRGTQMKIKKVADNIYPSKDDGDFVVSLLCKELRNLRGKDEAKFDSIVYNAKDRTARDLATWWEDHEKADEKRTKADLERRTKEWAKLSADVYTDDTELDGAWDYFVSILLERGFEAPKISDDHE